MSRTDVFGSWSKQYTLATNTILELPAISGQVAVTIKLLTGGTLEIGGPTMTGQTFGTLYPLSSSEVFNMDLAGSLYLYASGATCVVAIARGRSDGTQNTTP